MLGVGERDVRKFTDTRLRLTKRSEEGDFVVFADSCLIFDGHKRRAMVVTITGQPSQVFRLTIPGTPTPADWTKWQRPDYLEKSDAMWTFMHDLKKHDRSTNVPSDSFELRFDVADAGGDRLAAVADGLRVAKRNTADVEPTVGVCEDRIVGRDAHERLAWQRGRHLAPQRGRERFARTD